MKLYIKYSKKAFKEKPTVTDMYKITYDLKSCDSTIISYKDLKSIIEEGHSILLAKFKRGSKTIMEEDIEYINCIALDIDSKINKISLFEMQTLVYKKLGIMPIISYPTFSDTDLTKFRLIYRFENPVDVETFRLFYEALSWKFKKYIDLATKNANRIWAGTNKPVNYFEKDLPITLPIILKLINAYSKAQKKNETKVIAAKKISYEEFKDCDYIKTEYKEKVIRLIIDNIRLIDFITDKFGGNFKQISNRYVGKCCLHGGDNKNALVITGKTYRCYTHCGTGNVFTLAKQVYGITNFSQLAFRLSEEYGIAIPEEYIKRV